jgi:hypothetical protein
MMPLTPPGGSCSEAVVGTESGGSGGSHSTGSDSPAYVQTSTVLMDGIVVAQVVGMWVDNTPRDSPSDPDSPKVLTAVATTTALYKNEEVQMEAAEPAHEQSPIWPYHQQLQLQQGTPDSFSVSQLLVESELAGFGSNDYSDSRSSRSNSSAVSGYVSSSDSEAFFSPDGQNHMLLRKTSEQLLMCETPDIPSIAGSYNGSMKRFNSHDSCSSAADATEPECAPRLLSSRHHSVDGAKLLNVSTVQAKALLFHEEHVPMNYANTNGCCADTRKRLSAESPTAGRFSDDEDNIQGSRSPRHKDKKKRSTTVTQTQYIQEVDTVVLAEHGEIHPETFEAVADLIVSLELPQGGVVDEATRVDAVARYCLAHPELFRDP